MVRIRRTLSATAALASAEVSRRPCRRSSEEMVCRLFFTRWWISRMVASFDSSILSRLRTSLTSRSNSNPPVTSPAASTGMQRAKERDIGRLLELLDHRQLGLVGQPHPGCR